jgi:hypothetical protein
MRVHPGRQPASITIEARYHGPSGSGNGGYTCGRLAALLPGPVEVTLRRPPPLDRSLGVLGTPAALSPGQSGGSSSKLTPQASATG